MSLSFSYVALEQHLSYALNLGYSFLTCLDYCLSAQSLSPVIVLRVDIDYSIKKALPLLNLFNRLGIHASFFVRLHAPEYNPFSFENYRILKLIRDSGHEIGYHSEVMDQASIWSESPRDCLVRDIQVLQDMLGVKVSGVASHGGLTECNNLDFWSDNSPSSFGLSYEAYDREDDFGLFWKSLYVSDSEWNRWKSYRNGVLCSGDHRSISEHLFEMPPLVYLLIHSDVYYHSHFYE